MPQVHVVILNWNKSAATLACVRSVRSGTLGNVRILVVDNGSDQADVAALEAGADAFDLLRHVNNRGFTGGVNTGLAHAFAQGADYVWLLNNDAMADPDALEALVTAAEADPGIGLVSPVIQHMDAPDHIDTCCGLVQSQPLHFDRTDDLDVAEHWMRTAPERIWLMGTALLVSRALYLSIAGFDDRFFAYWEDTDYSLRSLKAGFRNVLVPEARVRHEATDPAEGLCSRRPYYFYYMIRNELLLLRKHGGFWRNHRAVLWSLHRQRRLLARLQDYPAAQVAIRTAIRHGLSGRSGRWAGQPN